jgi:lipid A 4'-phosphatase
LPEHDHRVNRVLVLLFLSLAAALVFSVWPDIDLWFSGLFWRPDSGFFLRDWLPVRVLHAAVPYITSLVILVCGTSLVGWYRHGSGIPGLPPRAVLYLLLSLALGPGLLVNTVLKDHWGRARPSQIVEFGGSQSFTPALVPADQCRRNCSFVAGHAAMGFYLVSFAFLVGDPRRRHWAEAGALGFGALSGMARIVEGGHFLSDTVFSGILVYATSFGLHRAIMTDALARARLSWPGFVPWRAIAGVVAFAAVLFLSVVFIDRPLAWYFAGRGPVLDTVFKAITELGLSTGYLIGLALLYFALRLLAGLRLSLDQLGQKLRAWSYLPLFVFVSLVTSGLLADLIKILVGRSRPKLLFSEGDYFFAGPAFRADLWSFPSGHTANAVSLAFALSLIWPRYRLAFGIFAALVAASRVILTQHYLSDVVASAALAIGVTLLTRRRFLRRGIDLAEAKAGRLGQSLYRYPLNPLRS